MRNVILGKIYLIYDGFGYLYCWCGFYLSEF